MYAVNDLCVSDWSERLRVCSEQQRLLNNASEFATACEYIDLIHAHNNIITKRG